MKRVIELVRVSTEQQADKDRAGIPAQREANQRTAKIYGLTIVRTIEIVDVSGAAVLRSPEMQQLLAMMESADIHGIVTKEFSRLIRPERFTDYALLQHFIDTQTVLYLPDGPIDLASKTGRLLGTIRAAIAGVERTEITERMQGAKESMRRAGKHPGGDSSLPFGVGYSRDRGWFYTADSEKVREAFDMFLGGETSYARIGDRLNIARASVRFILENPIYTGWRIYGEKRDPSPLAYVPGPDGRQGYRRKMKRSADDIIRVRVLDGLVTEESFARVQQMIELKRQKHWRSYQDKPARYTYNGFLHCDACGSPIYTHTSKYDFYQCKSAHPRERRKRALVGLEPCNNRYMLRVKLEPRIDLLLGQKLGDTDFLERVVSEYNQSLVAVPTISASAERALAAKLEKLQDKKGRILEAFFDGVIAKDERDRRIEEIEREMASFQCLTSKSVPENTRRSTREIQAALEPFAEWEFLGRRDKRALLAAVLPEIRVFRYAVKSVVLNLPAGDGGGNKGGRLKTAA